ncbi:MAG: PhoU domain-containing protein [Candidatus Odinarchaeia archaeon]
MENRKIIQLGSSSLVISLPKEWLNTFNLKKGDTINFSVKEDGSLILMPEKLKEDEETSTELLVSEDFEEGRLERKLIAAYLGNYSKIIIKAENKFTKKQLHEIQSRVAKLSGCQIIEENPKHIVIQNLIKIKDLDLNKAIYRAYLITFSMLKDAHNMLNSSNTDLLPEIVEADKDVDQFYFLTLKQIRSALSNFNLLRELELKPIDCIDYFIIMQRIEHIADHVVIIARSILNLLKDTVKNAVLNLLNELFTKVGKILQGAIDSFLLGNVDNANKVINENTELKKQKNNLGNYLKSSSFSVTGVIALCSIVDSLLRIADYATDIAEVSINKSV